MLAIPLPPMALNPVSKILPLSTQHRYALRLLRSSQVAKFVAPPHYCSNQLPWPLSQSPDVSPLLQPALAVTLQLRLPPFSNSFLSIRELLPVSHPAITSMAAGTEFEASEMCIRWTEKKTPPLVGRKQRRRLKFQDSQPGRPIHLTAFSNCTSGSEAHSELCDPSQQQGCGSSQQDFQQPEKISPSNHPSY
jgi:hypothetical protein